MPVRKAARKTSKSAKPPAKNAAKKTAKKTEKKSTARPGMRPDASTAEASERITARNRELQDWRGEKLALVRQLIHEADPSVVEEWKWGTPVWSHDGIICTGETYKQTVKLTFAKGAFLADPRHLFNSSLTGNVRRAIDFG